MNWIPIGNIRGPKGDTGTGLTIKDFYASTDELVAEVPNPNVGDAYGIGESEPYDIYIYSQTKGWVNSGSLQPDINEQAPTYAEATTLESLTSGEKISIAFGKIKKAIKDLISHIGNTSNPHKLTANSLSVKSIGVGTNIPENSDLNSYTTIGNYVCSLTATALSLSNCPSRGAFTMTVGYATGSSAYLYQEITHFSTGVKYYRTYTASTAEWSDWRTTYSTSYKPTATDVGAVPTLRRLENTDILNLVGEGNFYSTLTKNVPTIETAGYVRIVSADDKYKVVYWRPYNSPTEYSNVSNNGTWLGWNKIPTEPFQTQ